MVIFTKSYITQKYYRNKFGLSENLLRNASKKVVGAGWNPPPPASIVNTCLIMESGWASENFRDFGQR